MPTFTAAASGGANASCAWAGLFQHPPFCSECDLNVTTTHFSRKHDCGPAFNDSHDILVIIVLLFRISVIQSNQLMQI